MELVPAAYEIARALPGVERYALADQIRRCVISVPANIAEGQARQHPREFLQFLAIARGSLAELHTLILAAHSLDYIAEDQLQPTEDLIAEVGRPLAGLSNRLKSDSQVI